MSDSPYGTYYIGEGPGEPTTLTSEMLRDSVRNLKALAWDLPYTFVVPSWMHEDALKWVRDGNSPVPVVVVVVDTEESE